MSTAEALSDVQRDIRALYDRRIDFVLSDDDEIKYVRLCARETVLLG